MLNEVNISSGFDAVRLSTKINQREETRPGHDPAGSARERGANDAMIVLLAVPAAVATACVGRWLLASVLAGASPVPSSIEWLFPLRGRWLRYFLAAVVMALLLPILFLLFCALELWALVILWLGLSGLLR